VPAEPDRHELDLTFDLEVFGIAIRSNVCILHHQRRGSALVLDRLERAVVEQTRLHEPAGRGWKPEKNRAIAVLKGPNDGGLSSACRPKAGCRVPFRGVHDRRPTPVEQPGQEFADRAAPPVAVPAFVGFQQHELRVLRLSGRIAEEDLYEKSD